MDDAWIEFNDRLSTDLNLYLTRTSFAWKAAKRDLTFKTISGVSAELIQDNERFTNVQQVFPFVLWLDDDSNLLKARAKIMNWLGAVHDYQRLMFSDYPDRYFWAIPVEMSDLSPVSSEYATLTITFNVQPFAYEESGDHLFPVTSGTQLTNSYLFTAYPLIHVIGSGNGTITVNDRSYSLSGIDNSLWLDCGREIAYNDANEAVYNVLHFDDYAYPYFETGGNVISYDGDIDSLEVKPNWRTLI